VSPLCAVLQELPPFTTVTLVKTEQGWVLIAKDGKALGYVPEAQLHKLNGAALMH
jgi:hypothetical protein